VQTEDFDTARPFLAQKLLSVLFVFLHQGISLTVSSDRISSDHFVEAAIPAAGVLRHSNDEHDGRSPIKRRQMK
jgi:hypothetical protein